MIAREAVRERGSLRVRAIDDDISIAPRLARAFAGESKPARESARETLTKPNYFAAASGPISVRSEK